MLGTFFLVIAALLSPPGLTFALVGLTLVIMVLAIGQVSGAHLNPAVTLGLCLARLFSWREALVYVAAQVLGALLALGFGALVGRNLPEADPGQFAFAFEVLGTALLVFVVIQAVSMKLTDVAGALAIGLALAVGIAVAGPSSGGVLNPAIAIALLTGSLFSGSLLSTLSYLLGPLVAAGLAAGAARMLASGRQGDAAPPKVERTV